MDTLTGLLTADVSGNRFDVASNSVVDYLKATVPLGFWSVTRYDGAAQVYLATRDEVFGVTTGDSVPWSNTLCQYVVTGEAPRIVPDVHAVRVFSDVPAVRDHAVGAYVGIPIRRADGELFGTLCGVDRQQQGPDLAEHETLLTLLGGLLTHVLDADFELLAAARAVEGAQLRAETDAMTGLLNRRGWERYVQLEDERFRRYGDPCAVFVIDLDGLKSVNDTLGHAAGDEFIRRAAALISTTARGSDVVARLGGDEFGIIATQATEDVARTLNDRLEAEFARAGIGASIGREALSIKTGLAAAFEQADAQMYAVKQRRKLHIAS